MTDRRKSIFLPQVSRSNSEVDPGGPARWQGVGMMDELVYWTPFWSLTRINSTSFFSTLHCFSGATDESLCSGTTWMFIFAAVRTKPTLDQVLSRPPAGSGGAGGRLAWIRTAVPLTESVYASGPRRNYRTQLSVHVLERRERKQKFGRLCVKFRHSYAQRQIQIRAARVKRSHYSSYSRQI